jgi:hypothetical protein
MRIWNAIAPVIAALALASPGSADVLKTRDGHSFEGSFRGATEQAIRFEVAGTVRSFPVNEVAAVGFSAADSAAESDRGDTTAAGSSEAAGNASAVPAATASMPAARPATASAATPPAAAPHDAPAAPAAAETLSVPAGTRLRARLSDSLDPRRCAVGDRFAALLEAPIDVDGVRVAPEHTQVYGRVAEVRSGGAAGPTLALELTELLIQGQSVTILTGSQQMAAEASPPAAAAAAETPPAEAGLDGRIPGGSILAFRLLQPIELRVR